MPVSDYASELRKRLPDMTVEVAKIPKEEHDLVSSARVITSVEFDAELLDRAENLELFAGVAAGYEHLPLEALVTNGVAVTNASGIHAPNIAEQVIGYVLQHTRNLDVGRHRQERREWRHFQSDELMGSTVTIVGLGAIGKAIAERIQAFGVDTIGVRYTPEKGGPTDKIIGFETNAFHAALAETDYLLIASPLTETTKCLVGENEFKTLPSNAYLVNVGRGPIVETDALVSAIRSNSIAGAGLDVTDPEPLPADHPLWSFGNVTITPHNAGHSPKHWARLADIVAQNFKHLDSDGDAVELENLVRAPE